MNEQSQPRPTHISNLNKIVKLGTILMNFVSFFSGGSDTFKRPAMHTESVIRTDEVGIPPTRSMEWKIAGKPTIIWVYRTLIRRVNPRVALSLSTSLRRQVESFTRIDSLLLRLKNVEVIVMPKKPVGGVNSFSIICRHFLHVLLKSAGKLFLLENCRTKNTFTRVKILGCLFRDL